MQSDATAQRRAFRLMGMLASLITGSLFAVAILATGSGLPQAGRIVEALRVGLDRGRLWCDRRDQHAGLRAVAGRWSFKQYSAGPWRIVGAVLMIAGIEPVARFEGPPP